VKRFPKQQTSIENGKIIGQKTGTVPENTLAFVGAQVESTIFCIL